MNELIDYQTINENGKPAYVVLPYVEFLRAYPRLTALKEKYKNTYPHEIVEKIAIDEMSPIKAWRKYLRFSQKEIAEKLGITQAAYSQMESNKHKSRKETLNKIAKILNVSPELLAI